MQIAEYPSRDLSEAIKQAANPQLLVTKVKERLSAESARLTEKPLDEDSRGSRLAKHNTFKTQKNITSEVTLASSLRPTDTLELVEFKTGKNT